jgi:hypothetical protein
VSLGLAEAFDRVSAAAAVEVIRKCRRSIGVAPWLLFLSGLSHFRHRTADPARVCHFDGRRRSR